MVELKLQRYEQKFYCKKPVLGFDKKLVFYKYHKNDPTKFFLMFSIIDFNKNIILNLDSFSDENKDIIQMQDNREIYNMNYTPHCTIEIEKDKEFLVFLQEDRYFMHVDCSRNLLYVYTMEDIVHEEYKFKRISSTFFKDDSSPEYFYLSAVDTKNDLHIYRVSNDLKKVEKVDTFPGKNSPPHTLMKIKNCLIMSHEFTEAKYLSRKTNTIITDREMGALLVKLKMKINVKFPQADGLFKKKEVSKIIHEKYDMECIPSRIMLLDLLTKERVTYQTSGSNAAHFVFDEKTNMLYVSSHNFFDGGDSVYMFEPAILDKYELIDNRLVWRGTFKYDKGYRYTSHRVFYVDGKAYLCTFGKPNRLLFIDPEDMSLLFYCDIGRDELSENNELEVYLNSRHEDKNADSEFIALEVSKNGEDIFFLDSKFLFIYNFRERAITHKIDYTNNDIAEWNNLSLITFHMNYLE